MGQDREGDTGTGLHRIDWKPERPAHWSAPADSSGGRDDRTGPDWVEASAGGDQASPWTLADVTGCGDCPFAQDEFMTCEHPGLDGDGPSVQTHVLGQWPDFNATPGAPDWCPLRTAPLLVRLRVGP